MTSRHVCPALDIGINPGWSTLGHKKNQIALRLASSSRDRLISYRRDDPISETVITTVDGPDRSGAHERARGYIETPYRG